LEPKLITICEAEPVRTQNSYKHLNDPTTLH